MLNAATGGEGIICLATTGKQGCYRVTLPASQGHPGHQFGKCGMMLLETIILCKGVLSKIHCGKTHFTWQVW